MQILKKITFRILAVSNVVAILLLLGVGYSGSFHPASFPTLSFVGLTFPLVLAVNVGFLVFWTVMKLRMCILPIAGLLLAYTPVRTYIPFNFPHETPAGAIKVMSYNVHLFLGWDEKGENIDSLLKYIEQQDADILCLQEGKVPYEHLQAKVEKEMNRHYPYHSGVDVPGTLDHLVLYSKYPILHAEPIAYEHSDALSVAYRVKIDTDTVTVINTHFLSTGLSTEERKSFNNLFDERLKADSVTNTSRRLVSRLNGASQERAKEVDVVARYIEEHAGERMILCGDFNDGPISYTHRKLTRQLRDAFVESGNGVGVTFHQSRLYVRIDHILISPHWQSYNTMVDKSIKISDHYPVITYLKNHDK